MYVDMPDLFVAYNETEESKILIRAWNYEEAVEIAECYGKESELADNWDIYKFNYDEYRDYVLTKGYEINGLIESNEIDTAELFVAYNEAEEFRVLVCASQYEEAVEIAKSYGEETEMIDDWDVCEFDFSKFDYSNLDCNSVLTRKYYESSK